jgi:HAD superfamily phosphatase (TIGR01681 family)
LIEERRPLIFELDRFEKKYYPGQEIAPAENYNYSTDVEAMSLLYWAEHCVECAAPGCYQTCDLYQPRPDKRCRRLTFGAKKNRHFPSLRGYGVEIAFKKWAKLEAFANMSLSPIDTVLRGEKAIEAGAPVLNLVGMAMSKLKPKSRWLSATHVVLESLVRHLHRSRKTRGTPDAFLLEVYNPAGQTVRIQINIVPFAFPQTDTTALVGLKHSFRTTVLCPPGYSRNEIEASQFCHLMKEEQPLLVSMIPEADSEARLVLLSADFVKFSSRHNATRKIKCVVLDLDNTLWEGILVEGDEVQLRPEIPPLLKHLDERGILLSIASKNDFDLAWGKLQELGVSDYFLHPQISWAPKSHGVRKIAERLNLGLDSFAFIDDNPFELEQVTAACPEVLCLAQASIPGLIKDQRFQGSVTADSSRRRLLYKEAVTREAEQEKFGSDIQSFLARSDIRLEISEYVEADEERVAELVQRTNQLNCSGHKYTREQMKQILKDPQLEKYV